MLDPVRQADVVHAQGVSPAVGNVGDNDYFKTVALWRVMDEKTVTAFTEMWAEAKKLR